MSDGARSSLDVPRIDRGLDDIYVKETSICFVDGEQGRLLYRGYDIRDLAERSTFEETAFLLLHGHLPNRTDLESIRADLAAARSLPAPLLQDLRRMPRDSPPMDVLRTMVSLMSAFDPERDASPEANVRRSVRLVGGLASLIAAYQRLRNGQRILRPDPGRGHAEDFLRMVTGKRPTRRHARIMDLAMILYADHSMNASTFAATVAASTLADLWSAIVAAVATLKGPLHGGAIEASYDMIRTIGRTEAAEDRVMGILRGGGKVFGFGHRVYKTFDPRAVLFREIARELGEEAGDTEPFRVAEVIQETVVRELQSKRIYPNVDFYSGLVLHGLGFPADLATAFFAASRSVGWAAHVLEYWQDNRILRPLDFYVGPKRAEYRPVDERP
jgi:citrate synthase